MPRFCICERAYCMHSRKKLAYFPKKNALMRTLTKKLQVEPDSRYKQLFKALIKYIPGREGAPSSSRRRIPPQEESPDPWPQAHLQMWFD